MANEEIKDVIAKVLKEDNYYKILDVSRDVDDIRLKKAYRHLALKVHPDKCQEEGANEAFKKISSAYSCLSSSDSRRTYDLTGSDDSSSNGRGPGNGMSFARSEEMEEMLRELFAQHSSSSGNFPPRGFVFSTHSFGGRGGAFNTGEHLPTWLGYLTSLPLPVVIAIFCFIFFWFAYYVCAFVSRQALCLFVLVFGPRFMFPSKTRLVLFLAILFYDLYYKHSIISLLFSSLVT